MANHSENETEKGWLVLLAAVLGVLGLMIGLAFLVHIRVPIPHNSERFTQDDWQVFAEMYGAVAGTFFSAFAFVLLVYSSWMQRIELSLQRKELKATREEIRRQGDAQEGAEKALSAQLEIARKAAKLNALTTIFNSAPSIRDEDGELDHELTSEEHERSIDEIRKILREL